MKNNMRAGQRMSRRSLGKLALCGAAMSGLGAGFALPRGAHAASNTLIEAAKQEGRLVVYGDSSMIPFLIEGFTKVYPDIRVTSVPGPSWGTYNRFAVEQAAGRTLADVLVGGDDTMLTADRAGYLGDLHLSDISNYPAAAIPAQAHFVIPQAMLTTAIYNKSAVGDRQLPKDWIDFATLGADWDGQIIVADIRNSGSTLGVFAALYDSLGAEKAGTIVAGLRRLNAEVAPTTGVQVAKVMSGEKPLTATLHMGFYKQMRDKDAPVDFLIPTSGVMFQHGGMGVTKAAPHPNAAQLFVDFAMSKAGAEIYAAQGTYPSNRTAKVIDGFPPEASLKIIEISVTKQLAIRDDVIKWWLDGMGIS
jgi:iron(III) transport system substrate-binding protein